MIVIVNDNEMSISPNVGALSSSLSHLISGHTYNKFRDNLKEILLKIPGIGESIAKLARQSEWFFKSLFIPGLIFDELGFKYIGPVLGHRFDLLLEDLQNIKKLKGPILYHVITKKGKGYAPAENDPTYFHGVGPFDKITGKSTGKKSGVSYTKVFGNTLVDIAEEDKTIVAITAGMTSGTGLDRFEKEFPKRFFE